MVRPIARTPRAPKAPPKKKNPLAVDEKLRLFAHIARERLRSMQIGSKAPVFDVSEPVILPALKPEGFGSHAFIGGETLRLIAVRDEGQLVFAPSFVATFTECHITAAQALEYLTGFMEFWTRFEGEVRSTVMERLSEHTEAAKVEQLAIAKETNSDYGTW
jgi:hypothetical protein